MNRQQIEDPVAKHGTEKFKPLAITRLIQLVSERLAIELIDGGQGSAMANHSIDDVGVSIADD